MVCEHFKQGYDGSLLSDTFSLQTLGNGLVAVGAGLVANTAAEMRGFVAPFSKYYDYDLALILIEPEF